MSINKKEYQRKYRETHREQRRLDSRKLYWKDVEKSKAKGRERYQRLNYAERQRIITQGYKDLVFTHYCKGTPYCQCPGGCPEKHREFLTIDHINGGGTKHVRELGGTQRLYRWLVKNNYPAGFRILCRNCNGSYGTYGYCPHQKSISPNPS